MTARESTVSRDRSFATSRAVALVQVVHPFPSFLVSTVVVALIPIANHDAPLALYGQLGFGMLCYQFAIGIVNDLVDARDDALAKPGKPIAAGRISPGFATALAVALILAGLVITAGLPLVAWLVGAAGLACGLVYDLWLKRTAWSWLPFAIAFPLIPTWAWTATGQWDAYRAWVLPLGATLGLAIHLANQSPDIADDRRLGVLGTAQRIGERSRVLAVALFALAAAVASLVVSRESMPAAGLVALTGLVAAGGSPFAPRFMGRDGLFGLLAVAGGVLAIIFLAAAR